VFLLFRTMAIIRTTQLTDAQREAIFRLWNNEYPSQLVYSHLGELDAYLAALMSPNHYFVLAADTQIVGWAFAFTRDNERWFAIIVDSSVQRSGVGTSLLTRLKQDESTLTGWTTDHDNYLRCDGAAYRSPIEFYRKNGFSTLNDMQLNTEKLSAVAIKWEDSVHKCA